MTHRLRLAALAVGLTALVPTLAFGTLPGTGKIESVVPNARPSGAGCSAGPVVVGTTEDWYIEQGKTYTINLTNATDCAGGGTDATIYIEIRSQTSGSVFVAATRGSNPGQYSFQFTMPSNGCGPFTVIYCVGCFESNDGFSANQSVLNPAVFLNNCTFYSPVYCSTPVEHGTWGTLKSLYR